MQPPSLLTLLRRLGVDVALVDGRLAVRDPRGALTDELRADIRRQRSALIGELLAEAVPPRPRLVSPMGDTFACTGCGRFRFPKPTTCYWCRRSAGEVAA